MVLGGEHEDFVNVRVEDTLYNVLRQNLCFLCFGLFPNNNTVWACLDNFFVISIYVIDLFRDELYIAGVVTESFSCFIFLTDWPNAIFFKFKLV